MAKSVHFGSVMECTDGSFRSFHTLCGLTGDCNNRDPDATTCKACLRSRAWPHAVQIVKAALEKEKTQ